MKERLQQILDVLMNSPFSKHIHPQSVTCELCEAQAKLRRLIREVEQSENLFSTQF